MLFQSRTACLLSRAIDYTEAVARKAVPGVKVLRGSAARPVKLLGVFDDCTLTVFTDTLK